MSTMTNSTDTKKPTNFTLSVTLESDATFARGDGAGSEVDTEVEYDASTGLPFVRGRVLKGLLTEECANILFALGAHSSAGRWARAAERLFGRPGSRIGEDGALHVSAARLPNDLSDAVHAQIEAGKLNAIDVLGSLTEIRRQTSVDAEGLPEKGSLRSARVVLRGVSFRAALNVPDHDADAMALLAACVKAVRRGGLGRNRGRGRLRLQLQQGEADVTERFFALFTAAIAGNNEGGR